MQGAMSDGALDVIQLAKICEVRRGRPPRHHLAAFKGGVDARNGAESKVSVLCKCRPGRLEGV
jgi:hypothetical protein